MPSPSRKKCRLRGLERIGVEPNGERAIVDQVYLHHRAERARFYVPHVAAHEACEIFIQPIRLIGRARIGKRWAVAPFAIRVKRELAYYEYLASNVAKAEVGLSVLVLENAHFRDLAPEFVGLRLGVVVAHAKQNEQTAADFADSVAFDRYACVRDTLDQGSHSFNPLH